MPTKTLLPKTCYLPKHLFPLLFKKVKRQKFEKDETISLVDDLFKIKVISYKVHLKEEAAVNKDQQTDQSINDVLIKTTR